MELNGKSSVASMVSSCGQRLTSLLFSVLPSLSPPYGKIRIGGNDAKAEHSNLSWMSMLFAAGMGIGLMFWGVAEPVAV